MHRQGDKNPELSPRACRLLIAAFFALGLVQIFHHPLWQDEWQAWLVVRDSPSLFELFRNLRYEGHPALWYLVLYPLSRVTTQPWPCNCCTWPWPPPRSMFSAVSPFTRLQKILFIFGYFPCFEYCRDQPQLCRRSALDLCGCAVWPRRFPGNTWCWRSAFPCLQTSVYGLLVPWPWPRRW